MALRLEVSEAQRQAIPKTYRSLDSPGLINWKPVSFRQTILSDVYLFEWLLPFSLEAVLSCRHQLQRTQYGPLQPTFLSRSDYRADL